MNDLTLQRLKDIQQAENDEQKRVINLVKWTKKNPKLAKERFNRLEQEAKERLPLKDSIRDMILERLCLYDFVNEANERIIQLDMKIKERGCPLNMQMEIAEQVKHLKEKWKKENK